MTTNVSQWMARLVTKEDFWFLHKILGSTALISFAWRLLRSGADDMGFQSHPDWTLPTIFVHLALNLSSFEFKIPLKRIATDGGRIWPEYRLHSLVFSARSLACIGINWYEHRYGSPPNYSLNFWTLIAGLVAADISSLSVGPNHSNSVRDLAAPDILKYFFSVMQFFASATILFGFRRSSIYFYIMMVIQISAFLLTLRRKNLVSHSFNLVCYGALLAGGFATGVQECCWVGNDPYVVAPVLSLVACTAALLRMGPRPCWIRNKYLVWGLVYYGLENYLRPCMGEEKVSSAPLTKLQVIWIGWLEFAIMIAYGFYKSSLSRDHRKSY